MSKADRASSQPDDNCNFVDDQMEGIDDSGDYSSSCECDLCLLGIDDANPDQPLINDFVSFGARCSWRKIRNVVHWSPFVKYFQKKKYLWVQLAGHQGNFQAGESAGFVLKKLCPKERQCLTEMNNNSLAPFVPQFKQLITINDVEFIEMQDLLCQFEDASVMDVKIGQRTFLEEEINKALANPVPREDLYQKMIQIDPDEPSSEERSNRTITKPRYMKWRDSISSSASLAFRIEGIKKISGSSKNFKQLREKSKIKDVFTEFSDYNMTVLQGYCNRLQEIRNVLESSDYFKSKEIVGSSLLFVHDLSGKCNIWMIDFAKTTELPRGISRLDHRSEWVIGNREDGYLKGLDNLIDLFSQAAVCAKVS